MSTATPEKIRHTASYPCPICGGYDGMPRGHGERCFGFTTDDGWVHCSREEYAGRAKHHDRSRTWSHRLDGTCPCGDVHGNGLPTSAQPGPRKEATRGKPRGKIVQTYDYVDEEYTLLFQTVRYEPKDFKQRQPSDSENSGWAWNLKGVRLVPYRLPELIAAPPDSIVMVAEGEKDCDRLASLGVVATCNPLGAGKWRTDYNQPLTGKRVAVLADNDKVGRSHAQQVASSLHGIATEIRVVNLPGLPPGGDASDWLDANDNDSEGLMRIVEATPPWAPGSQPEAAPPEEQNAQLRLAVTCAASVKVEPVEFLVPGVLPRGKLVVLAGLGGAGKGSLWAAIVADLTRGRSTLGLEYVPPEPCDVLLLGCEDGLADTINPRLLAHDADVKRVHSIDGVRDNRGNLKPFSLAMLGPLERHLEACPSVKLVIIDPITGYVGRAGVKDHHDADLRAILEPLAEMAGRRGVTILTIKHLNKDEAKSAAGRIGGSIAYVNVPRAGFIVAPDPDEPSRRVLARFKWNLNSRQPEPLGWVQEPTPPDRVAAILAECGHLDADAQTKLSEQLFTLRWTGPVDTDADTLLKAASRGEKRNRNELDRAAEWLNARLADGPAGSILIAREGDAHLGRSWPVRVPGESIEAHKAKVLGRTKWWRESILKARLKGESRRGSFGGPWLFMLPDHVERQLWPPSQEAIQAAAHADKSAIEAGNFSQDSMASMDTTASMKPTLPIRGAKTSNEVPF